MLLLAQLLAGTAQASLFESGARGDLVLELFDDRTQARLLAELERQPVPLNPSPRARRLAGQIPAGAGPLSGVYRAIAFGRLDQAEQSLAAARENAAASAAVLDYSAAELASFAGHHKAALDLWRRTLDAGADDPALNAAAATSLLIAEPRGLSAERLDAVVQALADSTALSVDRRLALRLKLNFARLLNGRLVDLDRALSDYLQTRRQCTDCPWDSRLPSTQRLLAAVRKAQGRHAEAELLLKQALEWVGIAPAPQRADYPAAALRLDLARLYAGRGRFDEAEQQLRAAGVAFEGGLPNDIAGLNHLRDLALSELAAGNVDEARRALTRGETLIEAAGLPDYPWPAEFLSVRAALSLRQGELTRAEIEQRRALALTENELGADHPRAGAELVELANIFLAQGRPSEALERLHGAVAIERAWPRRDPVREGVMLFRMGTVYLTLGSSEKTTNIYDLIDERLPDAPQTRIRYRDGGMYLDTGTAERATEAFEDLLALDREYPDSIDQSLTAPSRLILGNLYVQQGRHADALPLLQAGLRDMTEEVGSEDPRLVTVLDILGRVNWRLGRLDDAERAYERAAALLAASSLSARPGVDALLQARAKLGLGRVYVERGDYQLALEQLEQAEKIAQSKLAPGHPLAPEIHGLLLSTQRKQAHRETQAGTPAAAAQ